MINQVWLWMKGERKNTRPSRMIPVVYDADPEDGYCLSCSLTFLQSIGNHSSGIH